MFHFNSFFFFFLREREGESSQNKKRTRNVTIRIVKTTLPITSNPTPIIWFLATPSFWCTTSFNFPNEKCQKNDKKKKEDKRKGGGGGVGRVRHSFPQDSKTGKREKEKEFELFSYPSFFPLLKRHQKKGHQFSR